MGFESLPGQAAAARRLTACLRSGRVPHALLFAGCPGTGRVTAARELARVLLCAEPPQRAQACGACASCAALSDGRHPDYREVGLPQGRQMISIDTVRQMQREASLKPSLSRRKVFVVRNADRLSMDAANCFLKTLEEPPPECHLVLVAQSLRELPETVLSRCWLVRFRNLPPARLAERLREHGVGADEARWLSRFAWGSPGEAERLRARDIFRLNEKIVAEIADLQLADNFRLSDLLNTLAGEGAGSATEARDRLQDLLECVALYYRDLALRAVATADTGGAENRPEAGHVRGVVRGDAPEQFLRCADAAIEAIERIGSNANRTLTLDNLFTQLARARADV